MDVGQPRDPWDQQEGEKPSEFSAFIKYRDLEPRNRSVRLAAESDTRTYNAVSHIAVRRAWLERAEAWDMHCDNILQHATEEGLLRVRRAHDARQIAMVESMYSKAEEAISALSPGDAGWQYLPRMLDTAVKISNMSTGKKGGGEVGLQPFEEQLEALNKEMGKGDKDASV